MRPESFKEGAPGRVIKVGPTKTAYWAFLPDTLPPGIELDIDLAGALSDADRSLGELKGLGRTLPNPHLLIHPFMRREAVLSSRIEGTQTDITQLYAYEAGQLPLPGMTSPPPEADAREVLNYVRAMEYGLQRIKSLPASKRLMRELHERLMEGVRGEHATPGRFRTTQNWIGPPGCTLNDATYVPPPVEQMDDALDALERYLHSDDPLPPLLRIALIHYQFEAIHPFLDGNGRIGRLLVALLLAAWDLLPLPLLYVSAYFEQRRDEYYELLLAVSEKGAWKHWLAYFLEGVTTQSGDALARAKRLQNLQIEWRKKLTGARASALPLRLADSLFESPVITIPQAQRILDVTYKSAQLNVRKLVAARILSPLGDTSYGRTYFAAEILEAIS